MQRSVGLSLLIAVTALTGAATQVQGQDYPTKPIRIITSAAGGGNDFVSRLIVQGLAGTVSQPAVVENRGAGVVPGEIVSKAPADGYTLLVAGSSFMIGHLLQNTPYNSVTDFVPITAIGSSPSVLVVHPSLPVKSVKELIALAKAKPGALNYASASIGSPNHLGAELFKAMANVDIVRVSYKGTGPAVNDLLGGQVQIMFGNIPAVLQHVKSGKLRALAVTSARPSALVPGIPSVAEAGVPGYEVASADSVFAPARTPAPIVIWLNREIVRAIKRDDIREKFQNAAIEVVGSTSEELATMMKSEIARMARVIKQAGIRVD